MDELENLFNNITLDPSKVNHEKALSVLDQMIEIKTADIKHEQLVEWNNYAATIQLEKPKEAADILILLHKYKEKVLFFAHPSIGLSHLNIASIMINSENYSDDTLFHIMSAMLILTSCDCPYDSVQVIHILQCLLFKRSNTQPNPMHMQKIFNLLNL